MRRETDGRQVRTAPVRASWVCTVASTTRGKDGCLKRRRDRRQGATRGIEPTKARSARWSEQTWIERKNASSSPRSTRTWKGSGVMVVAHYKGMTVAADDRVSQADEGSRRRGQGRQEQAGQAGAEGHRRGGHRRSAQGADLRRLLRGSGQRGQGVRQVRQGERQARDPGRRHGQDGDGRQRREGAGRPAVARRAAGQADRPAAGARDQDRARAQGARRACWPACSRPRAPRAREAPKRLQNRSTRARRAHAKREFEVQSEGSCSHG